MLLMIDNYDSFTFNLVQYFQALGEEIVVKRNNEITVADIETLSPSHIVISPGPCSPNEAGISLDVIRRYAGKLPILGVCLGHQAIAQVFGANVIRAKRVDALPEGFVLDAWFDDPIYGREIMGMSHLNMPLYSVQFHPEAILTEQGHELLANFLRQ
jgi:para-aminobenzoate synthetase component 2